MLWENSSPQFINKPQAEIRSPTPGSGTNCLSLTDRSIDRPVLCVSWKHEETGSGKWVEALAQRERTLTGVSRDCISQIQASALSLSVPHRARPSDERLTTAKSKLQSPTMIFWEFVTGIYCKITWASLCLTLNSPSSPTSPSVLHKCPPQRGHSINICSKVPKLQISNPLH